MFNNLDYLIVVHHFIIVCLSEMRSLDKPNYDSDIASLDAIRGPKG